MVRWSAPGGPIGPEVAFGIFGYGDTVGDLAVVGAVSGLGVGISQWCLLRALVDGSLMWRWVPATAAVRALGWTVDGDRCGP